MELTEDEKLDEFRESLRRIKQMALEETYDNQTQPMQSHVNVGFGRDVTIAELANSVAKATGYHGKIVFDPSKPDGAPRKWMDSGRLNKLGWSPVIDLDRGLSLAYADMLSQ
jgi:GDP-L-fucose synthase